jgi:small-conductance mechanosensitive channel
MSALFADPRTLWALAVVVGLPVLLVGAGEVEERLREHDSPLRPAVGILRRWTIPLTAVWTVAVTLLDVPTTALVARLLASGVLISATVAALVAARVLPPRRRHQPGDRPGDRPGTPQLLRALPRLGIVLVAAWLLLDGVWSVDLSAALTALGVTSLVVSFALQDTLSGLASGLLLLTDRPFEPGDWIRSGDLEGRIVDMNWRSSRVENRDGDLVVVPNSVLAGATLVNYDRPTRLHRVVVPVQVAYRNPPTLAKEMLLDAARSTPGVLELPEPGAHVNQVDDPLMGYEVHLWIDDYRLAPRVASDFASLVWYASHRHDVPLPSPAYDLFLHDAEAEASAAVPGPDEIGRRLRTSPLLDQLAEDELAALVTAATPLRFARGETVVTIEDEGRRNLFVIVEGRARLVADTAQGRVEAGELSAGDIFGLLGGPGHHTARPRVVAVDDCEVVVVDAEPAGEVIGRNPELSAAIEQLTASGRQRLERLATAHPDTTGPPVGAEATAGAEAVGR